MDPVANTIVNMMSCTRVITMVATTIGAGCLSRSVSIVSTAGSSIRRTGAKLFNPSADISTEKSRQVVTRSDVHISRHR